MLREFNTQGQYTQLHQHIFHLLLRYLTYLSSTAKCHFLESSTKKIPFMSGIGVAAGGYCICCILKQNYSTMKQIQSKFLIQVQCCPSYALCSCIMKEIRGLMSVASFATLYKYPIIHGIVRYSVWKYWDQDQKQKNWISLESQRTFEFLKIIYNTHFKQCNCCCNCQHWIGIDVNHHSVFMKVIPTIPFDKVNCTKGHQGDSSNS